MGMAIEIGLLQGLLCVSSYVKGGKSSVLWGYGFS